jgi:hypothetical protein
MKDKNDYAGYTIRLLPVIPVPGQGRSSLGFVILKGDKPVMHQVQNPLPYPATGIQRKEDAYKIAQWMIREFEKTARWPFPVPPHTIHDLKIETRLSIQNNLQ